jgi:hypothetical protein
MFVKIKDGQVDKYPYLPANLRKENKNVSFPAEITNDILAKYNVFPVKYVDLPTIDERKQVVSGSVELIGGDWTQVWTVNRLPVENASANVREHRDRLLKRSDWTQVEDVPVDKEAWAQYRQALRDIPNQVSFPFDIVWPVQPTT